jgi:hypothetical protein
MQTSGEVLQVLVRQTVVSSYPSPFASQRQWVISSNWTGFILQRVKNVRFGSRGLQHSLVVQILIPQNLLNL